MTAVDIVGFALSLYLARWCWQAVLAFIEDVEPTEGNMEEESQ